MKKVKIKTMPKIGTQKDYSLVYNTAVPASSDNTKEDVRNTMTAVPKEEANIEVENGETVIGDLNYDGLLELMSFQGKTHAQGGIPVNVPDGSFIYSNTPKMKIKDEDILKVFNMGKKKGGYTPAEISKQYQINEHIDTLKDDEADEISKKTANQMLKNNTEKLAMLAIVQEGMKGFENGIPSFAENVMAGLQQGQEQPQMKNGGLKKAQFGMPKFTKKEQHHRLDKGLPANDAYSMFANPLTSVITPTPGIERSFIRTYGDGSSEELYLDNYNTGSELNFMYNKYDKDSVENRHIFGEKLNTETNIYPFATYSKVPDEEKIAQYTNAMQKIENQAHPIIKNKEDYNKAMEMIKNQQEGYVAPPTKWEKYVERDDQRKANLIPGQEDNFKIDYINYESIYDIDDAKPIYKDELDETVNIEKTNTTNTHNINNRVENKKSEAQKKQAIKKKYIEDKKKEKSASGRGNTNTSVNNEFNNSALWNLKYGGEVLKKYQNGGGVDKGTFTEIEFKGEKIKVYVYIDNQGTKNIERADTGDIIAQTRADGTRLLFDDNKIDYNTPNGNTFSIPKKAVKLEGDVDTYNEDIKAFNTLLDENPDIQTAIYQNYLKHPQADKTLSQVEVIDLLKKGNTDNAVVQSTFKGEDFLTNESWDNLTGKDKNFIYKETSDILGLDPMSDNNIPLFQAAYQAAADVATDKQYIDRFLDKGFNITPVGKNDETYKGMNISPVDSYYGNTTVGQMFKLKENEQLPIEETTIPPVDEKETVPDKEIIPGDDFEKEQPNLDTWFAPDITNFVGSLTDEVNRYEPTQAKLDLVTPGYDLLDPTRQLAANQEQMARYQQQVENTLDPQMALAVSLGASGEGFQNAASVLGNVENANVGIVNQAYAQNAAIENQEIAGNESGRQQYVANMATLNENYDKAKNLKKWRSISAFNQGWHNFNKDQMMENVLFPQVHTNNITGDVRFSGNGRDIDGPNVYSPAYGTGNAQISPEYWGSLYSQANEQFKSIEPDPDKRAKMTDAYLNNYMKMNQKGAQGFDPMMYAQMAGIQ